MSAKRPQVNSPAAFLTSEQALLAFDELAGAHGLSPDAELAIHELIDQIVDGGKVSGLSELIRRRFHKTPEEALAIERDIARLFLIPIAPFVDGLEQQLSELGVGNDSVGTPQPMPSNHPQPTAREIVTTFLSSIGVADSEGTHVLYERMVHLLELYVAGTQTHEQIVAAAMRSSKVGGLDAKKGDIEELLEELDEYKQTAVVIPEKTSAAPQVINKKPDPPKTPPVPRIDAFTDDDATEIEALKKKTQQLKQSFESAAGTVESLVGKILDLSGRVDQPFRTVVTDRVKGKRDAYQTRESLEKMIGMQGRELAQTMEYIEEAVAVWESEHKAQAKQALKSRPVDRAETSQVRKAIEGVKNTRLKQRKATYSEGSSAPPSRRMDGVAFTPKLAGPLEELSSLTLTAFRRLSKNPAQATQKIQDKIDLLADQGFHRRVDGIRAWKRSPVYQAYLALTQQSLEQGKPVLEIAAEAYAQNTERLSKEEVNAMMKLNRHLRF